MANCKRCNGRGKVLANKRVLSAGYKSCPTCGGRGEVHLRGNALTMTGYYPTITFKRMEEQRRNKAVKGNSLQY